MISIFINPLMSGGNKRSYVLKGCVRYIFANLFSMAKKEHLWNKEKCFLFHF